MSPRMNPPRGPGMGPMPSYGAGMRGPPPNSSLGPGGPMPPMGMSGGPRQWQPNTSTPMNYSSSSPGNYGVSMIKYKYLCIYYDLCFVNRVLQDLVGHLGPEHQ